MSSAEFAIAIGYIERFQQLIHTWREDNFPNTTTEGQMLSLVEEVGELSRALNKRKQGIRGTAGEWTAEVHKELADTFISLLAVAELEGVSLLRLATDRWSTVRRRDWTTDPIGHGMPAEAPHQEGSHGGA